MKILRPISFLPLVCANAAFAQDAAPEGGALASFIPLILIMAVFYFLLIRPQQKRAKAHRAMLEAMAVGDEVMTSGGIFGKVDKITDNAVVVQVGGVQIPFQKQSIQSILPAGSLKDLSSAPDGKNKKSGDKPAGGAAGESDGNGADGGAG